MSEEAIIEAESTAESDGWDWARVEIFGHTKHYGRIREEDKLGAKMLRIDVPIFQEVRGVGDVSPTPLRWETMWYSAPAIFSLARVNEEAVMKANKPYVSSYRLAYRPEEKNMDLRVEEVDEEPF